MRGPRGVRALHSGLLITLLSHSPMAFAQGGRVFCGLGPPPGSAAFEDHERLQDQQRRALGYVLVCEGDLRRFDYASRAEPLEKATRRLAFTPVPLESTPFQGFRALGGRPDHFGQSGPSALHRTFRTPQGNFVDLFEWDMSVAGGQVMVRADLQTDHVNGAPAQLIVVQAPSARAVSILSWTEGRRRYELSIDANVRTSNVSPTLMQLASSLPKSVPARMNEPELRWPPGPPLPQPRP
jgi:hypothetical protein